MEPPGGGVLSTEEEEDCAEDPAFIIA